MSKAQKFRFKSVFSDNHNILDTIVKLVNNHVKHSGM